MHGKKKGLLALWMVWALLLTTIPMPAGADGTAIAVKLYGGTETLKPGTATGSYATGDLSSGTPLDENQAGLALLYGADLKGNCPDGYTRDGWRIWKDESGLKAGRWIGDTDVNWASYLTGYYDLNNGNVILAPNWVPKYAAGKTEGTDSKAAVIKRVEDGSILINGNTVTGGSIEADGSIQAEGAAFHFQWLHEYKLVETPADENQIKGTSSINGDYYDAGTGKWMKGNGETSSLGIQCGLQAGDIVLVKDIGSSSSDVPYYFSGYLWNEDSFTQTYFETYDRENKVFYAVVPEAGENYTLCLANMNNIMEINASVSVFRADSKTADQTSSVFTGGAGTYCCKVSYEQALATGTQKKTFSFLTDIVTVAEKYEITNVCGANGSCGIEIDGKEVYGPGIMAAPGQTVTVKAVPADGYVEDTVSIRKTGEISGSDVPYTTTEDKDGNKIRTFTMPAYPVTVTADFVQAADTKNPVISGVEDGKTYYGPVTFQVEDASPVDVWLDGKQIQLDEEGTYTIQPDNTSHTITATDKAGNTITCTITVNEIWMRDGITVNGSYELRSGTAYRLGAGKWKVAGDDTVYAGESAFYVPVIGKLEFQKQ